MQPARAGVHVKKFLVVTAASLLVFAAACSKEPVPTDATSAPVSTSPAASQPPSSPSPATTPPTTTSPPTSPAPDSSTSVVVDQSTPEAAMTSWLRAMFAGDTTAVCSLMASQGKAIADVPQAVETCSSMIGTMLDQLEPLAGAFTGLTIEGATVTDDTATFENATTQPAMAAQIIRSFKAVRIDGDWYVTEG